MIFLEKKFNCVILNSVDFKPDVNYTGDLAGALSELNPNKTIHVVIDLKRIPMLFILYLRTLQFNLPNMDLILYLPNASEFLKESLQEYKIKYKNTSEYPWTMPDA